MLGMATLPPPPLPARARPAPTDIANHDPMPVEDRAASESAAAAVARTAIATRRGELPAPHRRTSTPLVRPYALADLRALVGHRDARPSTVVAIGWASALGLVPDTAGATGEELVAWAERAHRLRAPSDGAERGDLLMFSRVEGATFDLVAIVTGRDARGVLEMVYLGGGVVRRGLVDPARPRVHRDRDGAVVNTYLRHGKRQPPRGTRYLAGELLVHVIHGS